MYLEKHRNDIHPGKYKVLYSMPQRPYERLKMFQGVQISHYSGERMGSDVDASLIEKTLFGHCGKQNEASLHPKDAYILIFRTCEHVEGTQVGLS